MLCPKCGTTNPDGAKFCISCQCSLDSIPDAAASAPGEVLYAGFWERFAALFIDNILLAVMTIPVFVVIGTIAGLTGAGNPSSLDALIIAAYLLPLLLSAAYFILMESGMQGSTFGKRLLKLRVVDTGGNRIGKGRALGRWLAHALSYITLYIGFFIQPFTAKKQALHDMVSGTAVVKTEKTGNTVVIIIAAVATFFILIAGFLAAVSLPAYMDYRTKAKVMQGANLAVPTEMAIAMYYQNTGKLPSSLAEAGISPSELANSAAKVEIVPGTGDFTITFNNNQPPSLAGKSILYSSPGMMGGWRCTSEDIPQSLLPRECR
jgi:uncharacterized RDD family membrane protein YckC